MEIKRSVNTGSELIGKFNWIDRSSVLRGKEPYFEYIRVKSH